MMNIRFLDYQVVKLKFTASQKLLDYLAEIDDKDFGIEYYVVFSKDKEFLINFKIEIVDSNNDGEFLLDFLARFGTSEIIDSAFQDSHFPKVNAPAIAYPFLRSCVNHFFVNLGYNSVLLPTYNFTKSTQK